MGVMKMGNIMPTVGSNPHIWHSGPVCYHCTMYAPYSVFISYIILKIVVLLCNACECFYKIWIIAIINGRDGEIAQLVKALGS